MPALQKIPDEKLGGSSGTDHIGLDQLTNYRFSVRRRGSPGLYVTRHETPLRTALPEPGVLGAGFGPSPSIPVRDMQKDLAFAGGRVYWYSESWAVVPGESHMGYVG